MEALHQDEDPSLGIPTRLLEAFHRGHVFVAVADVVAHHSAMCEFLLFAAEPAGCIGCVWEEPEAEDCDDKGCDSFEHEEPIQV